MIGLCWLPQMHSLGIWTKWVSSPCGLLIGIKFQPVIPTGKIECHLAFCFLVFQQLHCVSWGWQPSHGKRSHWERSLGLPSSLDGYRQHVWSWFMSPVRIVVSCCGWEWDSRGCRICLRASGLPLCSCLHSVVALSLGGNHNLYTQSQTRSPCLGWSSMSCSTGEKGHRVGFSWWLEDISHCPQHVVQAYVPFLDCVPLVCEWTWVLGGWAWKMFWGNKYSVLMGESGTLALRQVYFGAIERWEGG